MLAARAKLGSFFGPDVAESPPDMLFFAGGGGSVRGYPYRSIGVDTIDTPDDEDFETFVVGGAGLFETSAEIRYRIGERYGAVGFVDTGFVTENPGLSGEHTFKTGAGLGFRYYTGIGILRFDVATPLAAGRGRLGRRALHRHRTGVLKRLLVMLGVLVLVAITALAQDASDDSDNGFLLNLLENRLSTPGRQIRLSGVSGALSSRARIQRITISDAQGAWLEIDNVELDWSRLALLRGRVSVNRLSAERVAWLRRAEMPARPANPLPQVEAKPFTLPELPVSIQIAELQVPTISFDESVFGQAAELSLDGSLNLTRRRARHHARHPAPRRPRRQPHAGGRVLERDAAARPRPATCTSRRAASSPRCCGSREPRRST